MHARVRGHADTVEDPWAYLPGFGGMPLLFPASSIRRLLDHLLQARIVVGLLGVGIAFQVEVLQPYVQWVHAYRIGSAIEQWLTGERIVGMLGTTKRA